MASVGGPVGTSRGASGIIDLRRVQELAAQVAVLEAALGTLNLQAGKLEVAHGGGGVRAFRVPLTKAWGKKHIFFIGAIHAGLSLEGVFTAQMGPFDAGTGAENLAEGSMFISSTPVQNFTIFWLSVGE